MTILLDGKLVAEKIKKQVQENVQEFTKQTGIIPGLATVLVGENAASQVYIRNKIKTTETCGMKSFHHDLKADISQEDLLNLIHELNQDQSVHGILVQLPLPKHIDPETVINTIDAKKDVDGFHVQSMGNMLIGLDGFKSCTPLGIMEILKHYEIGLKGKDVLIIGRSNIVGKPMAVMMLQEHATVTIAHSRTQNLAEKARQADILVAAVGKAKMVKKEWIKDGAVVIDVGMNRDENGKLCGDVDFDEVREKTSYITPVPGGVGPMTITMLIKNTLQAARRSLQ